MMRELLNFIYYIYKRNNWMFDFSRYYKDFDDIIIDRPIFLLGTQGGGLTLVSRMLRRNKKVVSVTGNYKYWAGADEMQNVLGPILPSQLTGIKHKVPSHPRIGKPRGWLYAIDELINKYRNTDEDVNFEIKNKFKKIIKWLLSRYSICQNSRFTDKSQIYTIKLSFLNEILKDCNPKFILITRNPYALCYRSTWKAHSLKKLKHKFSFKKRLEFAAQHWANSMEYVLKDKKEVEDFILVRFEDILKKPNFYMKKICNFTELSFNKDMLPHPEHQIPFGSRRIKRWYPLRPEVNKKYLDKINKEEVRIIAHYCEKYAKEFGYKKPLQ